MMVGGSVDGGLGGLGCVGLHAEITPLAMTSRARTREEKVRLSKAE
jgi:hypothetical protein